MESYDRPTGIDEEQARHYRPQQQEPPPGGGMSRRRKVVIAVIASILILGILVGVSFLVVWLLPEDSSQDKGTPGNVEEFDLEDSRSYQEALYDIEQYYYGDYDLEEITTAAKDAVDKAIEEGEKDPEKLEDTGITALADALGDDHTQYLDEEQATRLDEDISGSFFGVGFMLRYDEDEERPRVVSVIDDSPSQRAGVKKDDVIMSVDGEDTKGEDLDVVVSNIRGQKGTNVELNVKREGEPDEITFDITREKIDIPELEYEIMDGKYGYLQVFNFNRGISDKIRDAVEEMQEQGAQGFILDLRNNPGGLLDEAVMVSSVFINDGVMVSYQTKGQDKVDEMAEGNAVTDLPLVVLTNGGSASSSEITAGAIKDHGRGVLVGTKTFGKGSVQKIYELSNNGAVKITIALYFLPSGESIDGNGIEPDIVVEYPDDVEKEEQMQLDKAKEVLQNLIDGRPATGALLRPAA